MIRLICQACKTVLEIDDAFAGGTCRCRHCGTIQTVPQQAAAAGVATGQAIFTKRGRGEGLPSGTGLDDLASAVASNASQAGLSGSGLMNQRRSSIPTDNPSQEKTNKQLLIILGAALAVILALLVILVSVLWQPTTNTLQSVPTVSEVAKPDAARPVNVLHASPNLCGIPLEEKTVVYLVDRGNSSRDSLADVTGAVLRSVESLGSNRRFQIVFWDNGTEPLAFPTAGPTSATPQNLEAARQAIEGAYAFGQSDAAAALKRVISTNPDVVMVITAKGFTLDETWVKAMSDARGTSKARVHILSINASGREPIAKLSDQTGGIFKPISASELKQFAR